MNPGEKWGTTGLPQRYKHNDSNKECDDAHVPKRIVCIPASGEIPACISALDIISMASIDCSRYLLRLRTLYFPPGSNNFLAEAFCHGDLGQALSDLDPSTIRSFMGHFPSPSESHKTWILNNRFHCNVECKSGKWEHKAKNIRMFKSIIVEGALV
jgi:hypothetical protein